MRHATNLEIAKILYEISGILEIKGIPFKPRVYDKAGYSIENLEEEVFEVYKKGGLKAVENILGVGISIAEKIEELFKTGRLKYYEKLKKGNKKIFLEIASSQARVIEVHLKNKLPKLIDYGDLKGDLQVHSNWTDGENSIEEMAAAAQAAGLEYIAITDHTKSLAMTGGLDEKKLLKQMAEIDKLNLKFSRYAGSRQAGKIKILKGAEVNILKDGSLDIKDEVLAKLDVVGVAVHSHFNLSRAEQTRRIVKAIRNKHADILFHPTGRLIQKRAPYDVDVDEIIKTAKETGTILEINADPHRLDLKDEYIRKAIGAKVKLAIDTDAHSKNSFHYLEFGIGQARRGWATKNDIINTRPWPEMLKLLK